MTISSDIPIERHPLQPFLPPNGRLLMLGSFPPPKMRWVMDFYYPNFTNDMWRIFGLIFEENPDYFVDKSNKTYRKSAIIDLLETKGIGFFDTAFEIRRLQGDASDKYLEIVTPTNISSLLQQMPQCRAIVTTGQKATETLAAYFGTTIPKMGESQIALINETKYYLYRMPSSSRAYPLPLLRKAEFYRKMFHEIGLL